MIGKSLREALGIVVVLSIVFVLSIAGVGVLTIVLAGLAGSFLVQGMMEGWNKWWEQRRGSRTPREEERRTGVEIPIRVNVSFDGPMDEDSVVPTRISQVTPQIAGVYSSRITEDVADDSTLVMDESEEDESEDIVISFVVARTQVARLESLDWPDRHEGVMLINFELGKVFLLNGYTRQKEELELSLFDSVIMDLQRNRNPAFSMLASTYKGLDPKEVGPGIKAARRVLDLDV